MAVLQEATRLTRKAYAVFRGGGLGDLVHAGHGFVAGRFVTWKDGVLDRALGIDTCGYVEDLASLGVAGAALSHANPYAPVPIPTFRQIMRATNIDPAHFHFVDFGSGKGRALFLAMEHGFRESTGVEIAPALHEVAKRNAAVYRLRRPGAGPIRLCNGDAADLAIPDTDVFLFFYNPFREALLARVAANIERAYRHCPRRMVVAYRNPVHAEVFDKLACLVPIARNPVFSLYQTCPPA